MERLILLFGFLLSTSALGATYSVQSLLDYPDSDTSDGVCNSTQGAGSADCTLRAAIEQANAHAGADTIAFSVTNGASALVISLTLGALPSITDTVTIDGRTAAGYANVNNNPLQSRPRIFISGGSTGGSSNGLRFFNSGADGSAVYAIGIVNFPGDGIEISNADSVFVDANWIGLNWGGSTASANGTGIYIVGSNGVVIGTSALNGIGNVISGNTNQGILGAGSFITIFDNHIGITSIGGALGNGSSAIDLLGGDMTVSENNVRNSPLGIRIAGPNAKMERNRVLSNTDGIFLAGNNSLINDNEVGNNGDISIEVTSTDNSNISNNFIYGSGNTAMLVGGGANPSDGNNIFGNEIKTVGAGAAIHILGGTNNDIYDNNIYDITAAGINLAGSGNFVANNKLGFTEGPLQIKPVNGNGIVVNGDSNRIGRRRDSTNAGNIIATGGSDWMDGVDVWFGHKFNGIDGNFIGAMPDGTQLGIGGHGVRIDQGGGNLIHANTIGFALNGVHVVSTNAITRICGNWIGVIPGTPSKDIGNRGSGIYLDGSFSQIKHDLTCAMFVESQYVGFNNIGITIDGSSNVIQDIYIGGDNTRSFGNDSHGVVLKGSSANNSLNAGRIRSNGGNGVVMEPSVGTNNTISANTLFWENAGEHGIDLKNDGTTANDGGDLDSGPNNLMNFPVLTLVEQVDGKIEVTYKLDYNAAETDSAEVYFYLADGSSRQGEIQLDTDDYLVAPNTETTKTLTIPEFVPIGQRFLISRAQDTSGNSSEFSDVLVFMVPAPSDIVFRDSFED